MSIKKEVVMVREDMEDTKEAEVVITETKEAIKEAVVSVEVLNFLRLLQVHR